MKKTLLALALFPLAAQAAGPCENYAKYGAIRAYKAETGTIQGSDPSWAARLLRSEGELSDYVVTISDQNEDGETWDVGYRVRVRGKEPHCSLVSVKKISSR